MNYVIYKITNNINDKYYIGRHATKNINDSYMGSGIGIKNAIAKYGVENFTKEIIATADSADALWDLEKEIVNEDIVKDPMSYNNAYGGKHYLHGLREYDYDAFIKHQRRAGQQYAKNFTGKSKEWHAKGGHASSNAKQKYKLTSPLGDVKILGYNELINECKKNDWPFNSIYWQVRRNNIVTKGKAKGVQIEVKS